MRNIIGKRNWFFLLSGLIMIPGLIAILLGPITGGAAGLKFSIDYTGGTKWEIRFQNHSVTPEQVKKVLASAGYADSIVATADDSYLVIRTKPLDLEEDSPKASPTPAPTATPEPSATPAASVDPSASPAASAAAAPVASATPAPTPAPTPGPVSKTGQIGTIATALEDALGPIEAQKSLTSVGPTVSGELTQQAMLLVLIGSIGIVLWMTYRFRDFRFGMTALAALVHDVVVVVGIFALLGTFFGVEVDGLFVTAMLTIIGFSVHDTIVVYDRVRENRSRYAGEPFNDIVNHSIMQTLGRSINTSVVVIFTLTALLLFGGTAIQTFILALLIGITSGTYSSIFNAAPLLTVWEEYDQKRRSAARTTAKRATA